MTSLLVSDTSVLVDLDRGGLLDALFRLPSPICVPDLLFASELEAWKGSHLKALGLQVFDLDAVGVSMAQEYARASGKISTPDAFALALARLRRWTLLTGDRLLREMAESEGVGCHGLLWVLDEMEAHGVAEASSLLRALEGIVAHRRVRLPREEVRIRLERYRQTISSNRPAR